MWKWIVRIAVLAFLVWMLFHPERRWLSVVAFASIVVGCVVQSLETRTAEAMVDYEREDTESEFGVLRLFAACLALSFVAGVVTAWYLGYGFGSVLIGFANMVLYIWATQAFPKFSEAGEASQSISKPNRTLTHH